MKKFAIFILSLVQLVPAEGNAGARSGLLISSQPAFRENKGQVTDQYGRQRTDIQFQVVDKSVSIFVGNGQLHYQFNQQMPAVGNGDLKNSVNSYRMDVALIGANKDAEVFAEDHQPGTDVVYTAGMQVLRLNAYRRLTYRNVYPDIDWVLTILDGRVEYDFVVRPGGNPANIRLRYMGATQLKLKNGAIIAQTPLGTITENKPYSYIKETQAKVDSRFLLHDNIISFATAKSEGTLVIDPVVNWATYFGDVDNDYGVTTCGDANGNVYLAGYTNGAANIATTGSYQTVFGGFDDAYLAKFDAAGNRLWSTYFGGESSDNAVSVACDPTGNIYVAGSTLSLTGIASAGSYRQNNGGGSSEIFLAKFDASGVMQWSTYFGGEGQDLLYNMAVEATGNIGLTGSTNSTTGIAGAASFQSIYGGGTGFGINARDAFIAIFSSAGALQWSTYYGGNMGDIGRGITFDPTGNVYICGSTRTSTGTAIATPGSHQPIAVTPPEGFLAKFDNTGARQWGTYYGDVGNQEVHAVVCDGNGNVYIGGSTTGATLGIATPGSHQDTAAASASGNDGFLVKFDGVGVRKWGTYYGGIGSDAIRSLAFANNHIYAGGEAESTTGIATPDGLQPMFGGGFTDGFLVRFDTLGVREWATYYGSSGNERLNRIAAISATILMAGDVDGGSGIATPNGFQQSFGGGASDAFLVQLGPDTIATIIQPFIDTALCQGAAFTLNFTTAADFQTGNVFTAQLSDASGSFASPVAIGSVISSVSGSISCTIPAATTPGTGYRVRIASSAPVAFSEDNQHNIAIGQTMNVTVTITANPGVQIASGTPVTFSASVINGGVAPSYQWKINGADIAGATTATYTSSTLTNNDQITVAVIGTLPCAIPDTAISNALLIELISGISQQMAAALNLSLYPNPNAGLFTVSGSLLAYSGAISMQLVDVFGQVVYSGNAKARNGKLYQQVDLIHKLAAGVYMLRITSKTGAEQTIRCLIRD